MCKKQEKYLKYKVCFIISLKNIIFTNLWDNACRKLFTLAFY